MKRILLELGALVLLAALAGAASNLARSGNREKHLDWFPDYYKGAMTVAPSPPPPVVPANPSGTHGSFPAPDTPARTEPGAEEFRQIDFAALLEEIRGGATLIDGRRTREYLEGHIPGAVSVSAWDSPADKVNELMEKGAVVEAPVVVYCGAAKDCEDSKIVSGILKGVGFVNIMIFKGGFPEWQAKAPSLVAKGAEPGELDLKLLPEKAAP
jgi:rhodanese-related sulfurtransferase